MHSISNFGACVSPPLPPGSGYIVVHPPAGGGIIIGTFGFSSYLFLIPHDDYL